MNTSNFNKQASVKGNKGCFKYFWFVFLIGWAFIIFFLYNTYEVNRTKYWTQTEAEVEHVELISKKGRRKYNTFLNLSYKYAVNGTDYTGTRLAKSLSRYNQLQKVDKTQQIYQTLDSAKVIHIYFNPQNPAESVVINQFTNLWVNFACLVLLINACIYGIKFLVERNNPLFLLLPILTGLCWLIHYSLKIGFVDPSSMISVVEKYDPKDCKFAKRKFDDNVYIQVNNFMMVKNNDNFNRNSSIIKVDILDSIYVSDHKFKTTAEAIYLHNGKKSIRFILEYDKLDECWFRFQSIDLLE